MGAEGERVHLACRGRREERGARGEWGKRELIVEVLDFVELFGGADEVDDVVRGGAVAEGDFPADFEAAAADRFADRAVGAVERR